jgi:hypothetical protein
MINRMTGSFILILVAAHLTPVGADDLQQTNCTGETNNPFHYHKIMCWILNKASANPLLAYSDILLILNKRLNGFLNIKLNELNIMSVALVTQHEMRMCRIVLWRVACVSVSVY